MTQFKLKENKFQIMLEEWGGGTFGAIFKYRNSRFNSAFQSFILVIGILRYQLVTYVGC